MIDNNIGNLLTRKYRYFSSVGFVHSLNPDYMNILSDLGITCFVSPLHDKQVLLDGGFVSPHYHILLEFPKRVTHDDAILVTNRVNLFFVRCLTSFLSKPTLDFINTVGGSHVEETRKSL